MIRLPIVMVEMLLVLLVLLVQVRDGFQLLLQVPCLRPGAGPIKQR